MASSSQKGKTGTRQASREKGRQCKKTVIEERPRKGVYV